MTYKIGTRVKCVTPNPKFSSWIGKTGVVVWISPKAPATNIEVKLDQAATDGLGRYFQVGKVYDTASHHWVPIIDTGLVAGIKGTCEPLDKLLSEVRHASVE
jgi:hypothetical protein